MMNSPAACRDLALRCRANAHLLRREGHEHEAIACDWSALGLTFLAAELEYDARGGMTLRQALERRPPRVQALTLADVLELDRLAPCTGGIVDLIREAVDLAALPIARANTRPLYPFAQPPLNVSDLTKPTSADTSVEGTTWDEPRQGEEEGS